MLVLFFLSFLSHVLWDFAGFLKIIAPGWGFSTIFLPQGSGFRTFLMPGGGEFALSKQFPGGMARLGTG